MNRAIPPSFLSYVLSLLLPARDGETVVGDLAEAYADRRARDGETAADFWYARQVASMAPRAIFAAFRRTPVLVLLCCFTATCGLWLGTMDIVLHHHDLLRHESISALIVGQALLTLLVLPLLRVAALRLLALAGAGGITWLAAHAWISTLRGGDTEGYILLICLALMMQAVLTLRAVLSRRLRMLA